MLKNSDSWRDVYSEDFRPHLKQLSPEKVCYVVMKAREFDVKDDPVEDNPGSDAIDDGFASVLADYPDDPVFDELTSFIDNMNEDEQVELVALAWLGRGDFEAQEWHQAVRQAWDRQFGPCTAYLLGMPLLPDYLENGLSALGDSCLPYEIGRL